MKKLIVFFILLLGQYSIAQNFSISQLEKENILNSADQALDKWAPGYNREYGKPSVEFFDAEILKESKYHTVVRYYQEALEERDNERMEGLEWVGKVLNGRKYYLVTYLYDPNVEVFKNGHAAQVYIWQDNQVVFQIGLGDGPLLINLDNIDYRSPSKRVVRYKPRLVKDHPQAPIPE